MRLHGIRITLLDRPYTLAAIGIKHAKHRKRAIESIREELLEWLPKLQKDGKLLEKQRLEQRTMYDLEMLEQMGFCHGI